MYTLRLSRKIILNKEGFWDSFKTNIFKINTNDTFTNYIYRVILYKFPTIFILQNLYRKLYLVDFAKAP